MSILPIQKTATGSEDRTDRIGAKHVKFIPTEFAEFSMNLRIGSFRDTKNCIINVKPDSGIVGDGGAFMDSLITLVDESTDANVSKVKRTVQINEKTDVPALAQSDKDIAVAEFLVTDTAKKQKVYRIGIPYASDQAMTKISTFFNVQANVDKLWFSPAQDKVEYIGCYLSKMDKNG